MQDWLTQSARAAALQRQEDAARTVAAPAPAAALQAAPSTPAPPTTRRKLSYKEQRELDALPGQMAALEAEQADIERQLEGGQLYASDPGRAAELSRRHAEVEAAWMAAAERLEALGGL